MAIGSDDTRHVTVEINEGVAVITLNRPEKLNALSRNVLRELKHAIDDLGSRDGIRGLVVTGAGRAFTAGFDLSDSEREPTDVDIEGSVEAFHDVSRSVFALPFPAVAAINGLAVGGGFEISLSFDRRIASTAAEVFLPENSIGLTISNASSLLLVEAMGRNAAIDFVLRSRRVAADEACRLGLFDEVIEGDVVTRAIEVIEDYRGGEEGTLKHLRLLRPDINVIEGVMQRETDVALNRI